MVPSADRIPGDSGKKGSLFKFRPRKAGKALRAFLPLILYIIASLIFQFRGARAETYVGSDVASTEA